MDGVTLPRRRLPIRAAQEDPIEKNVGHPVDIWARVIVGIVLLSLIALLEGGIRWIGLIGLIPILTVVFRWCPGWAILGINTCKTK